MDSGDLLQTIAEVAIAMAGFGGILAGLGYRATGDWTEADRLRLGGIAVRSLQVVFACLVPFVLHRADFSPRVIWGVSSALLGVAVSVNLIRQINALFPTLPPGVSPLATAVVISAQVLASLVLFTNAFGFLDRFAVAAYLTALILVLFEVAVYFVRMLETAFPSDAPRHQG